MLATLDWIAIALYFLLVFGLAIFVSIAERRKKEATAAGYFLGGRNTGWFVIGASLFASNIGSEHLVGLTGSGASGNFPAAQFEIIAAFMLLILGWVFVPFYLKSGVYTMPEFLEKRYGKAARNYLSWLSILAYVVTKIAVTIAAGGIVFTALLGIDFWTGALIIVIATGAYTVLGGLKAVLYTDMLQMIVLVGGSISVTVFGLMALGEASIPGSPVGEPHGSISDGISNLLYFSSQNDGLMSLWRGMDDADYPLLGIVIGAPILGVWYWCTDQFIVQRVLAAKDVSNARKGTIFAGFLKMLPLFLFVLPGAIALAIHENMTLGELPMALLDPETGKYLAQEGMHAFGVLDQVVELEVNGASVRHVVMEAGANGQLATLTEPDGALPSMVVNLLPIGFKGLVVSGLLAALMSSLSSVFNSCSTLFTVDIYKVYKPKASEKEMVWVGQIVTGILVVLGLAWIPMMDAIEGGLFKQLQSIQAYISPPIAAVFLLGIFSRRINSKGALAALYTGFVIGVLRLALEPFKDDLSGFLFTFADINFLHFAIYLFAICSVVLVGVSYSTTPPELARIRDITFGPKEGTPEKHFNRIDFALTIILLVIVAAIWITFS